MDIAALILSVISLAMSNYCLIISLRSRGVVRPEAMDGQDFMSAPGKAQNFNLTDFEQEDGE